MARFLRKFIRTVWGDEPEAWMRKARCRSMDPEIFFPSDGAGVEVARRICNECVVKAACLEYAIRNRIEHGVWGGTSERERRRIRRARELAASQVNTDL